MKILITCGGTGGHIYPAIAIAESIKKAFTGAQILFIGSVRGPEIKIINEAGYDFKGLSIEGLDRKSIWKNLLLPFKVLYSLLQAYKIIKKFSPNIIIGTGGYASFPSVYIGAKKKIPTIIQEQNAVPGLANRVLGLYANKICVAYPKMEKYFPTEKIVFTGNPLRKVITNFSNRKEACTFFNFNAEKKSLLILGGSLGAKSINDVILANLEILIKANIQIIWSTGQLYFNKIQEHVNRVYPDYLENLRIYPFIDNIDIAYSVADIIVARAGALTISELCIVGKPVIFVPSPNVTSNHQTYNVLPLVESNAALLIEDKDMNKRLVNEIVFLLQDQKKQNVLSEALKLWAKPHATEEVIDIAKKLVYCEAL
jgi:UDP-N-acetylglucosamine--N-acetylmuramyl-(pentapeptide) pyrophosphoryl-undecaprenol N-acetylglucosamine transferase